MPKYFTFRKEKNFFNQKYPIKLRDITVKINQYFPNFKKFQKNFKKK